MLKQNKQNLSRIDKALEDQTSRPRIPRGLMKTSSLQNSTLNYSHDLEKHMTNKLSEFSIKDEVKVVKSGTSLETIERLPKLISKYCRIHGRKITHFAVKLDSFDNWTHPGFLLSLIKGVNRAFPKLQQLKMRLYDRKTWEVNVYTSIVELLVSEIIHFKHLNQLSLELNLNHISKEVLKILTSKSIRRLPALRDFNLKLNHDIKEKISLPEHRAIRNLCCLKSLNIELSDGSKDANEMEFIMFILQSSKQITQFDQVNLKFGKYQIIGKAFPGLDYLQFQVNTPDFKIGVLIKRDFEYVDFEFCCSGFLEDLEFMIAKHYSTIENIACCMNYRVKELILKSNILSLSLERTSYCDIEYGMALQGVIAGLKLIRMFSSNQYSYVNY